MIYIPALDFAIEKGNIKIVELLISCKTVAINNFSIFKYCY